VTNSTIVYIALALTLLLPILNISTILSVARHPDARNHQSVLECVVEHGSSIEEIDKILEVLL